MCLIFVSNLVDSSPKMSDNLPTSSRLDSLSRRSTPTAKPGLKFKPKVVARRSKEERAADAPTDAPERKNPHANRGNASRGRGSTRGGRGGKALAGTHLVQAGPLASVNVFNETSQTLHRPQHSSASPTPEYLTNLLKRENTTRESSVGLDSDDEEDLSKINMNKEYRFATADAELFPVRAPRSEHVEAYADQAVRPQDTRSTTPESVTSEDAIMEDTLPTSVKDEPLDQDLKGLLEKKDMDLHKKLCQLEIDSPAPLQYSDQETKLQEIQDHKTIISKLLACDNKEDQFLFFQLPRILPELHRKKTVEDEEAMAVKSEEKKTIPVATQEDLEGKIGNLRVHKSGKITLKIGNVVLDVGRGSDTSFLQEVVVLEKTEEQTSSYLLGHIQDKVVATPRFE